MPSLVDKLDAQLEELFNGWNPLSTVLALVLLALTIYPLLSVVEPDIHPLLLTRQATISPIRQPGESAIYRSADTSHDAELRTGLNVKDPGTPKWHGGRDGDLRDIWRKAMNGVLNDHGEVIGQTGKILSVYGSNKIIKHDYKQLSKQINVIGQHVKRGGGTSVAIYLPNSIELLLTIFAGAFYDFVPVLIPYEQPASSIAKLLQFTNADYLIATAGSISVEEVKQGSKAVRNVVWVVEPSSREMDWTDNSETVAVWHELINEANDASTEVPTGSENDTPPGITFLWLGESAQHGEIVTFTQKNIVAAVGAQIAALPLRHRFNAGDLFLPADSLSASYVLVQTLAALYSNASVALNSVAGPDVELPLAVTGVSPTIIAASAESLSNLHTDTRSKITSSSKRWALNTQKQALRAGVMPPQSLMSRLNAPTSVILGKVPGQLRLIYAFERVNAGTPPLSAGTLADMRAFTGARVVYALTAAPVAGTVAQTNFFDYRLLDKGEGQHAHFGVPVSSVEAKVVDKGEHKVTDDGPPVGELVVNGPAVLNGQANLAIIATFRDDSTLAYV